MFYQSPVSAAASRLHPATHACVLHKDQSNSDYWWPAAQQNFTHTHTQTQSWPTSTAGSGLKDSEWELSWKWDSLSAYQWTGLRAHCVSMCVCSHFTLQGTAQRADRRLMVGFKRSQGTPMVKVASRFPQGPLRVRDMTLSLGFLFAFPPILFEFLFYFWIFLFYYSPMVGEKCSHFHHPDWKFQLDSLIWYNINRGGLKEQKPDLRA